ncbi:SDR family oxidoreductase [Aspergillus aculeatinus CBS 121060]|uniref:NAD(P)-binding protein n=1 Tax=Aspergillus aculeatinus CBS 121060 TaxID=1448322 RepID=A0ACD1H7U5_9EURO|nr:NAD(P)-binding protein [Aspergillus aculeatinus CBS 121060]RAH69704.1 NAD(P)-binding protein [Aspergillus aculeatinus CBS 121060]
MVTVLITGCGKGGIGEALALQYQAHGCTVLATVLPSESHEHLTSVGIQCFQLDVTKDESVHALCKAVETKVGDRLDILVNNAGICYTMTAIDTDVSQVQQMFDVNVFGPIRMVHTFHPWLIRAQGCVVNIGSVGGIVPYMYGSSYNASKAALHHWGNTLRVEMSPLDVRVINIISGNIGTNILTRDASRSLPPTSFYAPLQEEFRAHVQRVPNTTDRMVYARSVVQQSLRPCPPAWYWVGNTSTFVWLMDCFAFRTVWDLLLWPVFHLGKLKSAMKTKGGLK